MAASHYHRCLRVVKADEVTVGSDSISPLGTVENPAEGNLAVSDKFPDKDKSGSVIFAKNTTQISVDFVR